VAIPCRDEGATIASTVYHVLTSAAVRERVRVVIAVDPASSDNTFNEASRLSRSEPAVSCFWSDAPGRGAALDKAISGSTDDSILMLHADTKLPARWDELLIDALERPGVMMTAFEFSIDRDTLLRKRRHPYIRTIERVTNLRSKWLWLPYGDQALGITRDELIAIGGIPQQCMMEDFELSCRVRAAALVAGGRLELIPAAVLCSGRRWEAKGVYTATMINWWLVFCYTMLHWSPEKIHRTYYPSYYRNG